MTSPTHSLYCNATKSAARPALTVTASLARKGSICSSATAICFRTDVTVIDDISLKPPLWKKIAASGMLSSTPMSSANEASCHTNKLKLLCPPYDRGAGGAASLPLAAEDDDDDDDITVPL